MEKVAKFRDRLVEAMGEMGYKASDLSRATGISRPNISHWVNGQNTPVDPDIFMKLSRALLVNELWLRGYDVEKGYDAFKNIKGLKAEVFQMINEFDENQLKDTRDFLRKFIARR